MKLDAVISDRGEEVMVTKETEPRIIMKEGDYLRQRVVLDDISDGDDDDVVIHDDDVKMKSSCLPRPSSAPADERRVNDPPSTLTHHHHDHHHQLRITEKLLKLFCAPPAQPATTSPPPCRGTARQRRRFMRVVKDEHAPPPERVTDNPNIICRYSQEYLTRHYAAVERERTRQSDSSQPMMLPYTTSGHTILKKSSTDPTSDRCVTSTTSLKHTTFCDVVTVVDSDCEVHEERLRHADNDAEEEDSIEGSPPSQSGFFLSQPEQDTAVPDEVDGALPEPCPTVQKDEVVVAEEVVSKDVDSVGLMNIFSSAATMELECEVSTQSPDEPKRKTSGSLPTTKHVKLVELMAQMRADDDAERS